MKSYQSLHLLHSKWLLFWNWENIHNKINSCADTANCHKGLSTGIVPRWYTFALLLTAHFTWNSKSDVNGLGFNCLLREFRATDSWVCFWNRQINPGHCPRHLVPFWHVALLLPSLRYLSGIWRHQTGTPGFVLLVSVRYLKTTDRYLTGS